MNDAGEHHPGRVLGALGSADRLRAFAAVVLAGPAAAAEVAATAGAGARSVERELAALRAAGLVEVDGDGRWSVRLETLRAAARDVAGMRRTVTPEELGADKEQATVLRSFLVDGRLTSIPVQRSKRLVLLDFLAQRFEPGTTCTEAAVNAVLAPLYDDPATLRRALVDEGFLDRRAGRYWRTGGTFDVE